MPALEADTALLLDILRSDARRVVIATLSFAIESDVLGLHCEGEARMKSADLRTGISPVARRSVWLRRTLLAGVAMAVMAGSAIPAAAAHRRSEPSAPVVPPAKDFGELPKGPLQIV